MPYTQSFLAFKDIEDKLEQALHSERGITLTFETKNAAVRFVARAHSFRKMDRQRNASVYPDPANSMHGSSVYDVLMLKHNRTEEPLKVVIEKILPENVVVDLL